MKKNMFWLSISIGILLITMFAMSCKKELSGNDNIAVPEGKNQLTVYLTDDPSIIFDSVFIDIQRLEVKVERPDGSEHWDTLPIRSGVYNILKFRNGTDTLFASAYVADGAIEKIRLTLGNNNSVMKNGSSFPLLLHNSNRQVIIDIPDIDRIDPDHFRIWIDFDGHGSVIRLNNNQFELRPRIHSFNNSRSGKLEGRIKPAGALPAIVSVISGTDTLLAIPEDDGEFKVRGIRTAMVKLVVRPSNGYLDTVINNIAVRQGEDTKLPDILLHR